jgi:hypothetical protein
MGSGGEGLAGGAGVAGVVGNVAAIVTGMIGERERQGKRYRGSLAETGQAGFCKTEAGPPAARRRRRVIECPVHQGGFAGSRSIGVRRPRRGILRSIPAR